MRIAFVGLPLAALLLRADGHDIVWAGICRKGALGTRRLTRVLGKKNVAIVPDLARVTEEVRAKKPDLVVSWFWTKKVPASFLAIAPAFGVHPSLLPRHRGPDPYFWAIDKADATTGVTAHLLDEEYDTGGILGQETLAIDPSWNAWTLAKKLDRPSLAVLRATARSFPGWTPRAQDGSIATEAPAPTDDDLELRWDQDAASLVRRVRAASPWPGAFTVIGDEEIIITEARAAPLGRVGKALVPGEAAVREDGIAIVRAADGAIELLQGRIDEMELDAGDLAEAVSRAT